MNEEDQLASSGEKKAPAGLVMVTSEAHRYSGVYMVPGKNQLVALTDVIGLIREARGTFESLGMAYDPTEGTQTMVISFLAIVPAGSKVAVEIFGVE